MEKVIRYTLKKTTVGLVSAAIAGSAIMVGPLPALAQNNSAEEETIAVATSIEDHRMDIQSWTANSVSEIKAEIDRQLAEEPTDNNEKEDKKDMSYVIQWGDTVWGITNAFEIDQDKFVEVNDIENPDLIYAGDTVTLDVAKAVQEVSEAVESTKQTAKNSVQNTDNKESQVNQTAPNNKGKVNTPVETPKADKDVKADTPVEAPEADKDVEADTSVEAPEADKPVETPEADKDAEADAPVETPEEDKDAEVDAPVETPEEDKDAEVDAPVETPEVDKDAEVDKPVEEDKKEPVITTKERVETVNVPFKTTKKNDPTLEVGRSIIQTTGRNGQIKKVYTQTYKDGVLTGEKLDSEQTVRKVIDEVILVGTKAKPQGPQKLDMSTFNMVEFNKEILSLINAERSRLGVQPLAYKPSLQKGTDIRAKELVTHYTHTRPNGLDYDTAFTYLYDNPEGYFGENIAYIGRSDRADIERQVTAGETTFEKAFAEEFYRLYHTSPGHNNNMISKYDSYIAVSIELSSGYVYNAMIIEDGA